MDIVDCDEGDQPQQATPAQDQPTAASCAMVVDIIGGDIAVESAVGKGSTFTVKLRRSSNGNVEADPA